MASVVFDSSAVLAHLGNKPGSEKIARFLGDAIISAVNYAEVIGKLRERQVASGVIRMALSRYGLLIAPFDEALAERTGELRPKTKAAGLSLGDRACLALGEQLGLPVLTADRSWKDLGLPVDVQLFR